MPIYEFLTEEGEKVEVFLPMLEAPSIGTQRVIDGRLLTRLPSSCSHSVSPDRRFVAWSQPTCLPDGSVPPGVIRAPDYDLDPKSPSYLHARFSGKRDVDQFVARSEGRVTYGK